MRRRESTRQYPVVLPALHRGSARRTGAFLLKALFVVLAVSAIVAIVGPRYASAEKAGKELSVRSLLRTIVAVNKSYRTRYRKYADGLESLAKESRAETVFEAAARAGYVTTYKASRNAWSCAADPKLPGTDHYFVDESGVIRFRADGPATLSDPKVD